MDITRLTDQLIRDEGLVLHAYQDSLGYWTIGAGRLIDARKGGGISEAEARLLLTNDIHRFHAELLEALPWVADAPEGVQEVLTNMAFNLGVGGLLGFRNTLALIKDGKCAEAAAEMLRSRWAGQVGARAKRLSETLSSACGPENAT